MYGSGLGLCFLAYFRLRNCRPQLASRKCLPPRLKEKKLGFFSIYLGLFPFGSVFNQVSISRLYISPTVRCTDSRWKLELNTLPKVKSLDKFKKTPLFFLRLWKSIVRLVSNGVNTISLLPSISIAFLWQWSNLAWSPCIPICPLIHPRGPQVLLN